VKQTLRPIIHKDQYTDLVERDLLEYLKDVIFDPLFEEAREEGLNVRENEELALREALRRGIVWYADGTFYGKFNAAISRELRNIGASKSGDTFKLEQALVPLDIRQLIAASKQKSEVIHKKLISTLEQMQANLKDAITGIDFVKSVDKISSDLQKQFSESVVDVEGITVEPEITPGIAKAMREELTLSTDLEIKNFSIELTQELRAKVQQNLFAGGRADRLQKVLESEYGIAKRKARFIAEQETSLAVSKFREARYKELGSTEYIWSSSNDALVRLDHQELNKRVFSWNSPPIVDTARGRRANPGEDYNCRCVAIPIINFYE
jgi:SPP1 gp7 family putative phage head morphogenesis protein